MRNLIVGTAIFAMTSAYADFSNVEISNFTGSYKKPDGTATASKLVVPESITSTINIELKGVEDGYILQYGDKEFHFKNPPSFVNDVEEAKWNGINYKTNLNKMSASLNTFDSEITGSKMNIKKFVGNCTLNREHSGNYGLQLLDACLTNSSFNVSSLLSSKLSEVYNLFVDVPGFEGINASEVTVNNATLAVKKNAFTFKGKVNMGISANVTIAGKSLYEVDKKRVSIKVDTAKASFINIKNKLFQELEKSETETLKVDNPYIYIYLK